MSESSEHQCPACGSSIPLNDINISQNIALCRACGKSFPFDELVNAQNEEQILSSPPKHLKITKTPQGLTLTYRKGGFVRIFLIIFALVWTVAIWGAMIPQMIESDSLLFCLPFVIIDIIVVVAAAFSLSGKSTITVSPGKGTYFAGAFGIGLARQFDLTSETRFGEKTIGHSNNTPIKAMTVTNPSRKSVTIGHFMAEDTYPYLKAIFRQLKK